MILYIVGVLDYRGVKRGCQVGKTKDDLRPCKIFEDQDQEGNVLFLLQCACSSERCNALGTSPFLGLALYLPLDGNADDVSGRHRQSYNNGVEFDGHGVKGMSGYFDGNSYIIIPNMVGYLPGMLTK